MLEALWEWLFCSCHKQEDESGLKEEEEDPNAERTWVLLEAESSEPSSPAVTAPPEEEAILLKGLGCLQPRYDSYNPSARCVSLVAVPQEAVHVEDDGKVSEPLEREQERSNAVLRKWCSMIAGLSFQRVVAPTMEAHRELDRRRWKKALKKPSWKASNSRARNAVENGLALMKEIGKGTSDVLDMDWSAEGLLERLFGAEYADTLMLLAKGTQKLLEVQPPLAEADLPCKVFGDTHGQFRDLLLLFHAFGVPSESSELNFVFNGDFVDRGAHQIETIGMLLALKLCYPTKVWLVRGNHEDKGMNQKYGFRQECTSRLGSAQGKTVFDCIHEAFDRLPLACLLGGQALAVHGGVGQATWDLTDLRELKRPIRADKLYLPENQWLFNVLWSDPVPDDCNEERELQKAGLFGVHVSPRTANACMFSKDLTELFCVRNGLSFIVRSHSTRPDSQGFEVMHKGRLISVFSARDYEYTNNDGAVLLIEKKAGSLTVKAQVFPKIGSKVMPEAAGS